MVVGESNPPIYFVRSDILDNWVAGGSSVSLGCFIERYQNGYPVKVDKFNNQGDNYFFIPWASEHHTIGFEQKLGTNVKNIEIEIWVPEGGQWRECCVVLADTPLSATYSDYGNNTLHEWRLTYWNTDIDIANQSYISLISTTNLTLDRQTIVCDIKGLVNAGIITGDFYLCFRKNQTHVCIRSIKINF